MSALSGSTNRYAIDMARRQGRSSGGSPDDVLAGLTREQWEHYKAQFGPVEEALAGEVNSRALVDQARVDAPRQALVGRGSLLRDMARYGAGATPGGFTRGLVRQVDMGDAEGAAQAVNTARVDQRERNLGLASNLMQIGRGVAAEGLGGLSDVAGMAAQRNAQNAQMKAQQRASTTSTVASLGSAALMAFLM